MLILILLIYTTIFVGIGIYDFLNFSGSYMYFLLALDILFGFFIISSTIESYAKKEVQAKVKKK